MHSCFFLRICNHRAVNTTAKFLGVLYVRDGGGSRILGWGVLNCANFDHTHLNPAHYFHLKCATFSNFDYDS